MDRRNMFFRQPVTEGEMDEVFDLAEFADQKLMADQGLIGIQQNGDTAEHNPTPDLTVDISAPVLAYDQEGQRINVPGTGGIENVDVSVDSNLVSTAVGTPGNEKIVSVFVEFDRALSNPRIDGNSLTVQYNRDESYEIVVEQGAESSPPATPPALKADALLFADITRDFGQTQIFDADIDLSRKQTTFKLTTSSFTIDLGQPEETMQAILQELQNHVDGVAATHPASAIDYAGGGAWADATTNPATDVEDQLDKIISDLAGAAGADKIGATISAVWADATGIAATDVDGVLEEIIGDLAAVTGAIKMGFADDESNWADTTGLVSDDVQNAIDEIVDSLGAATGASLVGNTPAGNIAATDVQAAIDELDSEKGGLSTVNAWTNTNSWSGNSTFDNLFIDDSTVGGNLNGLLNMDVGDERFGWMWESHQLTKVVGDGWNDFMGIRTPLTDDSGCILLILSTSKDAAADTQHYVEVKIVAWRKNGAGAISITDASIATAGGITGNDPTWQVIDNAGLLRLQVQHNGAVAQNLNHMAYAFDFKMGV